jgi:hypothetical protein
MQTRKLYCYRGPVTLLGRPVANNWTGSTLAASPQKARSNLAYQFKKQMGLIPSVSITLAGDVQEQTR